MREIELIRNALKVTTVLVREKYLERGRIEVSSKSEANDLLTEVDLAVQECIIEQVEAIFPEDHVAAEEGEFSSLPQNPDARCWVIDPIDGTQNFVRGLFPTFGISVAFAVSGEPVAGGIALPMTRDTFLAERGRGAFRNDKAIQVSRVDSVSVSRVEIDFSGRSERKETLARASRLICTAGQIRCNCSTVVALCSVAAGEMEAFFHVALNPWDYAAGQLIVEESGGKTSRLDGNKLILFDQQRGVLATNGLIHTELLSLLS